VVGKEDAMANKEEDACYFIGWREPGRYYWELVVAQINFH
jgi:hypothetical protein